MNKARDIFSNLEKIEEIINLMNRANKAIIEIYNNPTIKVESKPKQRIPESKVNTAGIIIPMTEVFFTTPRFLF